MPLTDQEKIELQQLEKSMADIDKSKTEISKMISSYEQSKPVEKSTWQKVKELDQSIFPQPISPEKDPLSFLPMWLKKTVAPATGPIGMKLYPPISSREDLPFAGMVLGGLAGSAPGAILGYAGGKALQRTGEINAGVPQEKNFLVNKEAVKSISDSKLYPGNIPDKLIEPVANTINDLGVGAIFEGTPRAVVGGAKAVGRGLLNTKIGQAALDAVKVFTEKEMGTDSALLKVGKRFYKRFVLDDVALNEEIRKAAFDKNLAANDLQYNLSKEEYQAQLRAANDLRLANHKVALTKETNPSNLISPDSERTLGTKIVDSAKNLKIEIGKKFEDVVSPILKQHGASSASEEAGNILTSLENELKKFTSNAPEFFTKDGFFKINKLSGDLKKSVGQAASLYNELKGSQNVSVGFLDSQRKIFQNSNEPYLRKIGAEIIKPNAESAIERVTYGTKDFEDYMAQKAIYNKTSPIFDFFEQISKNKLSSEKILETAKSQLTASKLQEISTLTPSLVNPTKEVILHDLATSLSKEGALTEALNRYGRDNVEFFLGDDLFKKVLQTESNLAKLAEGPLKIKPTKWPSVNDSVYRKGQEGGRFSYINFPPYVEQELPSFMKNKINSGKFIDPNISRNMFLILGRNNNERQTQ